jgi:hypothetical protein
MTKHDALLKLDALTDAIIEVGIAVNDVSQLMIAVTEGLENLRVVMETGFTDEAEP